MKAEEFLCRELALKKEQLVAHFNALCFIYNPLRYATVQTEISGKWIDVAVDEYILDSNDPLIFLCHPIQDEIIQWHKDLYLPLDSLFVPDYE